MTRSRKPAWSPDQRAGLAELRELAAANPHDILAVGQPRPPRSPGADYAYLAVNVTLSTRSVDAPPASKLLADHEDVAIVVGPRYPEKPPTVCVRHDRFVDVVHVLYGNKLCIYLDEDREWHPSGGMRDVLEQTWRFLDDAANDRFDASTALFHSIGGLDPVTQGAPTAVVRRFPGIPGKPLSLGSATPRTARRIDIGPPAQNVVRPTLRVVTISVPARMPYGPGHTVGELRAALETAGGPRWHAIAGALGRTHAASGSDVPLYIVLAVARPPSLPEPGWHLCVGRIAIPSDSRNPAARSPEQVTLAIGHDTPIEWCNMSDQRPEHSNRRDDTRPVIALRGRTVELWGCGGLGSWLGEYLVRAGVAHLTLRDHRSIQGDLLVRQNFTEEDVGFLKATQLKARLDAIADLAQVDAKPGSAIDAGAVPDCDLVIDATVSEAVGAFLQTAMADAPSTGPVVASVATDAQSATLGLVVIGSGSVSPAHVQTELSQAVLARGDLEPFHRFWADPNPGDMVLPMPGCSTPTFHGSAADAAGLAATMLNLIAGHLDAHTVGMHLINMPHSGIDLPRSSLPEVRAVKEQDRRKVWVRSGGRCVVCGYYLLDGDIGSASTNVGEVAHIKGKRRTHRGDPISPTKSKSPRHEYLLPGEDPRRPRQPHAPLPIPSSPDRRHCQPRRFRCRRPQSCEASPRTPNPRGHRDGHARTHCHPPCDRRPLWRHRAVHPTRSHRRLPPGRRPFPRLRARCRPRHHRMRSPRPARRTDRQRRILRRCMPSNRRTRRRTSTRWHNPRPHQSCQRFCARSPTTPRLPRLKARRQL